MCVCKGIQVQSRLQQTGTLSASAWPPRLPCYRPTVLCPTFASQCGHSYKEKSFAHFENVISVFYYFLNCLIHGVSECSLPVLNTFNDVVNATHYKALNDGVLGCRYRYVGYVTDWTTEWSFDSWRAQGFSVLATLWGPPIFLLSGYRDFLEGNAAESRSWTLSKLLVTTVGFEPAASQMRSRCTSEGISLNKVNNKNAIAPCSYCTEVRTLTLQCSWLFCVAPVCNIKRFSALPTKCIAVISECQHKGAIIPPHSATLSDCLVETQSVY